MILGALMMIALQQLATVIIAVSANSAEGMLAVDNWLSQLGVRQRQRRTAHAVNAQRMDQRRIDANIEHRDEKQAVEERTRNASVGRCVFTREIERCIPSRIGAADELKGENDIRPAPDQWRRRRARGLGRHIQHNRDDDEDKEHRGFYQARRLLKRAAFAQSQDVRGIERHLQRERDRDLVIARGRPKQRQEFRKRDRCRGDAGKLGEPDRPTDDQASHIAQGALGVDVVSARSRKRGRKLR